MALSYFVVKPESLGQLRYFGSVAPYRENATTRTGDRTQKTVGYIYELVSYSNGRKLNVVVMNDKVLPLPIHSLVELENVYVKVEGERRADGGVFPMTVVYAENIKVVK